MGIAGTHILMTGDFDEQTRRIRGWAQRILKWLGIPVIVEGADHLKEVSSVIFTSNHVSTIDIPLLFAAIPRDFRMVAKKELLKVPFIGWVIRRCGFIPIDRRHHRQALKSLEKVKEYTERGVDFYLAAEGTRSRTGNLLPFKKGPFVLAIQLGVPVVPVTLFNTRRVMPKKSLLPRSRIPLKVRIHPPISTEGLGYEDREALKDRVYDIVKKDLEDEAGAH